MNFAVGIFNARALHRVLVGLLFIGAAVITVNSAVYFDDEDIAPFVLERLPVPHEAVWLGALHIHVVAAAFSLPACLLLLSKTLLRRARGLHRWLGRLTAVVVLLLLLPSGAWLALFAKGGAPVTAGFLLSAVVVAWGMVRGIATARRRDVVGHQRCMRHVLAQLSVAVTSRALLMGFDLASVDADVAYVAALWLPVLASAVVVELLSVHVKPGRSHEMPESRRVWRAVPVVGGAGRSAA